MRRSLLISLLGFFLASLAAAQTIYQIELRDHANLLSNDRPIQRGRLALFHRHPDGAFLSIPKEEIARVVTTSASAGTRTLLPGESVDVGPTGEGHGPETAARGESTDAIPANGPGSYGSGSSGYGRNGSMSRPGMPTTAPPATGPSASPMAYPNAPRGHR